MFKFGRYLTKTSNVVLQNSHPHSRYDVLRAVDGHVKGDTPDRIKNGREDRLRRESPLQNNDYNNNNSHNNNFSFVSI